MLFYIGNLKEIQKLNKETVTVIKIFVLERN